jgi:hypothetical protein
MKTFATLFASLTIVTSASAVEYVTLNVSDGNPDYGQSSALHAVPATSLVEIVGQGISGSLRLRFTKSDGTLFDVFAEVNSQDNRPFERSAITGITQIELRANKTSSRGFVTFKITPAEQINAVGPSNVLVIPENSIGDFDLIVESSGDMLTWSPFYSATVTSPSATNFFRVRIIKTPTP